MNDQHEENIARADRAGMGVQVYRGATGQQGEPLEQVLGDLICDLHHFCDAEDVDWTRVMARGLNHYETELEEYPNG